jgi:glyoxylase-like metal-dependent hydrolase (beta-lactamase superfamily II)
MNTPTFRFDIGAFQCLVVSDGTISVPSPAPPGSTMRPEDRPTETMDVTCLFLQHGNRRVLIDTGCGTFFQPTTGTLLHNLRAAGIDPAGIDTVVYTHAHPDHIGGTFDADLKPIYPNARQVITRKEWDCFAGPDTGPNSRMFALARKNLLPARVQFDLVEDNAEVLPGVKLVPALGHTLGGVMIEISSHRDRLLCIGDLIHSQLEFTQPEYYSFLDSAPAEATRLRTDGLAEIARRGVLVFACHFPFPGIGHIVQQGDLLSWRPIPDLAPPAPVFTRDGSTAPPVDDAGR